MTLTGRARKVREALLRSSRYAERGPDGRPRLRAGWRIDRLHDWAERDGISLGALVELLRDLPDAGRALRLLLDRIVEPDAGRRTTHAEIARVSGCSLEDVRAAERWLVLRAEGRLHYARRKRSREKGENPDVSEPRTNLGHAPPTETSAKFGLRGGESVPRRGRRREGAKFRRFSGVSN